MKPIDHVRINENGDVTPCKPTYDELAAMLRELEWEGCVGGYEHETGCPICGATKNGFIGKPRPGCGQHEPDCRLSSLLSALREGQEGKVPESENPHG